MKLRDVLVTISCLLIQPNPASALNEAAGKLASEDWDGFCRRAKLMTEIHAAVPSNIAAQVREAQTRGDDAPLEAGPVHTQSEPKVQGAKGKERVRATPTTSKVQQPVTEDEENIRRRGDTQEPESDPESDWIPGPDNPTKRATPQTSNIFGIKGLDDGMLNTTPKRIYPTATPSSGPGTHTDPHPFIHVLSKRTIHTSQPFHLQLPISATPAPSQPASTNTPELLKFSHHNPFSAIQLNNQAHPLIRELSYTWEDSEVLHDTGLIPDSTSKLEVKKRLAGQDFEAKKRWEMKRFQKAGCDLSRYNRGNFGPRIGMGRL